MSVSLAQTSFFLRIHQSDVILYIESEVNMVQEVVQTHLTETVEAVNDLCEHLRNQPASYNCVIFFATSSVNYQELQDLLQKKFTSAQIIGATTSGEITAQGFTTNSIVLNAISDTKTSYSAVLIDDANRFPIISKKSLAVIGSVKFNCASIAAAIGFCRGDERINEHLQFILCHLYTSLK